MLTPRTALISPIVRLIAQLAAIRAHRLLERHELERFSERSREPIEWLAGNSRVNRRKSRRYMVRLVCATVLMTLMASAPAAAQTSQSGFVSGGVIAGVEALSHTRAISPQTYDPGRVPGSMDHPG